MSEIFDVNANKLVTDNYQSYAKYVLETRALPSVEDGLKLVQRRIIYGSSKLPMKLIKTAALAGDIMKLHPHGDCSGQIYTMTYPENSQKIFNIKGNHGGPSWSASAPRYTECYLNEVGRFNYCQFIDYADYEEGELGISEPKSLPCLIPYGIVEGSSGMGVGLSTNLMPLNLLDLIECYKKYIKEGVYDPSMVRPDPGPYLIENNKKDTSVEVSNSKGRISISSIIIKESPTKISIGKIPGRSIESLLEKLGWWISEDYVAFTNESSDTVRYTFEILNNKKGEITIEDLIYWVDKYARTTTSYQRCMVDTDKSAIYCTLKYVMDSSLAALNKAIDKWLDSEKIKIQFKLDLYIALKLAKSKNLFDNLAKQTTEDLVKSIVKVGVSDEIAREITKKPISYLTRDHDYEMKDLEERLKSLQNHNRTEYLLDLYNNFESMIVDRHNSRQHALYREDMLTKPKVRLESSDKIEIYQDRRQGYELGDRVYLVGESGWVYIRSYTSPIKSILHLDINEKIVGISTSKYKYLEIQTVKDKKGVSYEVSNIDKEKYLVKLEDDERAVLAQGWNDPPKSVSQNLVTKMSKARNY